MNVNVRLSASKKDLDETRAVCEAAGVSLAKAIRDGLDMILSQPRVLGDIAGALFAAPVRDEWSFDKQVTGVSMPPEKAKLLSTSARQITASTDLLLRMVVDGIRLGIIKPTAGDEAQR